MACPTAFKQMSRCTLACLVFAVLALVLGVGLFGGSWLLKHQISKKIDDGIREQVVIDSPHAKSYELWETNYLYADSTPLYQYFTFYNVTNVEEVKQGAFPVVKEVGPYWYRQLRKNIDVEWKDHGNLVVYREWNAYRFEPNMTAPELKETDVIVNLNPAYMGAMAQAQGEAQLLIAFTGPRLSQLFEFLSGTFTLDVIVQAVPNILQDAKNKLANGNDTQFFATWANATSLPSEDWQGMLVSLGADEPSLIPLSTAQALFTPSAPYALLNTSLSSTKIWRQALQNNETAMTELKNTFTLSDQQLSMLLSWLGSSFAPQWVYTPLTEKYKIDSIEDIAYLQWGQGTVTPDFKSVTELYPEEEFPGTVELAIWWYDTLKDPFASLPVNVSRKLLNGTQGIFSVDGVAAFLGALTSGDLQQVQEIWGLDLGSLGVFIPNFLYDAWVFSKPSLEAIFAEGGGLFTARTVHQWLWHVEDPLLQVLMPSAAEAAIIINQTTPEMARQLRRPNTVYTGKNDLTKVGVYKEWNGLSSLDNVYNVNISVNGLNDIGFFHPHLDDDTHLQAFDDNYARLIGIHPTSHVTYKGVDMLRYEIDEDTWDPSYDYPQPIKGFCNVTGVHNGSSIFISNPHMYGADPRYVEKVKGFKQNATFDISVIDIEPHLGNVMHYDQGLQINIYLDPSKSYFNFFNRGIRLDVMVPVMIAKQTAILTDDQADELKSVLYMGFRLRTILFWTPLATGIALVVLSALLGFLAHRRYKREKANGFVSMGNAYGLDGYISEEAPYMPINES